MRNPVLISNLDPSNHEWAKERAKMITEQTGHRTTMSDLVNEGLAILRQKCDDEEALAKAKAENEPWLRETGAD